MAATQYDKYSISVRKFASYFQKISGGKNIVVYGVGVNGRTFVNEFYSYLDIIGIADSDQSVRGSKIAGMEVYSEEVIENIVRFRSANSFGEMPKIDLLSQ